LQANATGVFTLAYQLKEKGILSSEEFEAQKSEIMADN